MSWVEVDVVRLVPYLLALAACSGEPSLEGLEPRIPLEDLGAARVVAPDLDLADPSAVWLATEHAIPGMTWSFPSTIISEQMWRELSGESVADPGLCPYVIIVDGATAHRSECRSQEGYEWSGEVRFSEEEDEAGRPLHRAVWDLEVVGDTADADFDRASLRGEVIKIDGFGDVDLVAHVQVNLELAWEGWWSRRNDDAHEAAWSDLGWTGWAEVDETADGRTWKMDMAVRAGAYGTMRLRSARLDVTGCEAEPDGDAQVSASDDTVFDFGGSRTCDRCVEYDLDGTPLKACP